MLRYVGYRMRIVLQDSRDLVGTFMAFDKHMNIVIGECEEYRKIKAKKNKDTKEITPAREEKRVLGLVLLRGDAVVSMSIEGPPPPEPSERLAPGGPGSGKAMGRGVALAPPGAPQMGLGGPMSFGAPVHQGLPPGVMGGVGVQVPRGAMPPTAMGMPRGMPGMPPGMGMPGGMPPGMMPPGMMPRGPRPPG